MGKRIINETLSQCGENPVQFLTELTEESFEEKCRDALPEAMVGSEFLARYKSHDDPITEIQPDAMYRILGPTAHAVYENQRVLRFMDHLKAASNDKNESALVAAGECMLGSHDSYRENCLLSVPEIDFLVDAVRARGPEKGLYGAKITGGGSGGTVAVFGSKEGLTREMPAIAREYRRLTGYDADIFDGTSPGAIEFGSLRYTFGPTGWMRSI
jgi:L-arabinokinase